MSTLTLTTTIIATETVPLTIPILVGWSPISVYFFYFRQTLLGHYRSCLLLFAQFELVRTELPCRKKKSR